MSVDTRKQAEAPNPPPSAAWWQSPRQLPGRVRAWGAANPRRALLVGFACLLSIAGAVAAGIGLTGPGRKRAAPSLAAALEALDRGAYQEACRLAEDYQRKVPQDQSGGPDFVRAAAAARLASASASDLKSRHFLAAANLLIAARHKGFPRGRDGEGLYLLGKSLFGSGQLTACRPVLREGLKLNPRFDWELRFLLAEAYLLDSRPNPVLAEEENLIALREQPPPEWHGRLLVQRARILLARGKAAESLAVIQSLPQRAARSGEALVVRGQLLAGEARALAARAAEPDARARALRKTEEAIAVLRAAQGADTLASGVSGQATYLIGLCLLQSGDARQAAAEFQHVRRRFPNTAEATAAAFEEAELLRRGKSREALPLYEKVLRTVDPERYSNPWLPLAELRKRMLLAYQDYLRREDFAGGAELAAVAHPLLPEAQAAELRAEAQLAWGRALLAKAETAPPAESEALRREGRKHFRQAGGDYAVLAERVRAERRYTDALWDSAQGYLAGHDYEHVVKIVERYLHNETRRRQAEALAVLGEALLALGRLDDAIKRLDECIRLHPRDAAAFRARLLAARARVEKGDAAGAEKLLTGNLQADLLTPASSEWRESLFDLAALLHSGGRYEAAIPRLDEAAQRYPDAPRAADARWLAADCERQRGLALEQSLPSILVESRRRDQARQASACLDSALARCRALRDALGRKQASAGLTRSEALVLRNCDFALGEVLSALGRLEEAAKAYAEAIQRYAQSPETLEAYLQTARIYQRLGRAAEARGAAEQAKLLLSRLKSDAALVQTTTRDRRQWTETLDGLTPNP